MLHHHTNTTANHILPNSRSHYTHATHIHRITHPSPTFTPLSFRLRHQFNLRCQTERRWCMCARSSGAQMRIRNATRCLKHTLHDIFQLDLLHGLVCTFKYMFVHIEGSIIRDVNILDKIHLIHWFCAYINACASLVRCRLLKQ